jgi:hypothetical protein
VAAWEDWEGVKVVVLLAVRVIVGEAVSIRSIVETLCTPDLVPVVSSIVEAGTSNRGSAESSSTERS